MNPTNQQLIEKKIDGTLSPEEHALFDRRMIQDGWFAEEYVQQQEAVDLLRYGYQQGIKHDLRIMMDEDRRSRKRTKTFWYPRAAVFLLLTAGVLLYQHARSPSGGTLYETYYERYQPTRPIRGAWVGDYDQGVRLYQQQKDAQAIAHFLREPLDSEGYGRTLILLGNSYLQTQQNDSAVTTFARLAQSEDTFLKQTGQWYLALSYLKTEQIPQAQELLRTLGQGGMYQKEARAITASL